MSTNRFVKTLSEMELPSVSSLNESGTASAPLGATNSETGFFTNITWQTWLIIILILSFLGINIFYYLQSGTEATISIFAPILKIFGYETLETTKQTIQTSATGTKTGVDIASDTTTGTINTIEDVSKNSRLPKTNSTMNNQNQNQNSNVVGQSVNMSAQPVQNEKQQTNNEDSLQKALSDSSKSNGVQPDDSLSRIQSSSTSGKAGWCFIGEDRGFRTCSQIGVNDKCMSGDVFPTQDVCMNPNLRA